MAGTIKIPLSKGAFALIDEDDLPKVSKYKWYLSDTGYAVWRGLVNGRKRTIRMHRLVADVPEGMITDHINHDRLDNRKLNLRICDQSANMRNLTHQGKGYWFHSQNNNWVVELHGKHIGCFDDEKEASEIAEKVRNGFQYIKPERTECRNGHSKVGNYYLIGKYKTCKTCVLSNQRRYYAKKQKLKMA